jgi:hypothetical protein
MRVTTISNLYTMEYFFTTDHCQKHGLGDRFVPCTYTLPMRVVKRKAVKDGLISTIEQLKAVFYYDMTEIPNPDPSYQPQTN